MTVRILQTLVFSPKRDVLEDERARTGLAHGAHRLRKHVALVHEAAVLAAHGKGLAG